MVCKLCGGESKKLFSATVLNKYQAEYQQCQECGFLQVGQADWLSEAYAQPINIADTGYVKRNWFLARRAMVVLSCLFGVRGRFLDYAAGYGLLVRLLRDFGLDVYWQDSYAPNLFARGFEYEAGHQIAAVTCFECFEHFAEPAVEIDRLLAISRNLLFSTTLLPDAVPAPQDWWYYGLDHGQHLAFFSEKALLAFAKKRGLYFYTNHRDLHLLTDKPLPNWLFKLLLNLAKLPTAALLAAVIGSKTFSDHQLMMQRGCDAVDTDI